MQLLFKEIEKERKDNSIMLTTYLKILSEHYQYLNNDGEDVIQGLTQTPNNLPPKYFYDKRGSELFEQICELQSITMKHRSITKTIKASSAEEKS